MATQQDLAEITALRRQLKAAQRLVFESLTQDETGADDLLDKRAVANLLLISYPTLERWTKSPALNFPQPVSAPDGRVFYLRREVMAFKARLETMISEGIKARSTGGFHAIVDLYGPKVAIWLSKTSVALRKEGKRR